MTIAEPTVPGSKRKVNELMLVSLILADRRRRGTKRQPAQRGRQGAIWK